MKREIIERMLTTKPTVLDGEVMIEEALVNAIKETDKTQYRVRYGVEAPDEVERCEIVPIGNKEITGMQVIGYYKDENERYKPVVLHTEFFTEAELQMIEDNFKVLQGRASEDLAKWEKEISDQKGKRAGFLMLDIDYKVEIRPDFSKMLEIPLSQSTVDYVLKGRTGVCELKLYITTYPSNGVFVYETDRGNYVMPFSGYTGCPWTIGFVDHVASAPITFDSAWAGTFNIDNAKTVEPVEFFKNYEDTIKKVSTNSTSTEVDSVQKQTKAMVSF